MRALPDSSVANNQEAQNTKTWFHEHREKTEQSFWQVKVFLEIFLDGSILKSEDNNSLHALICQSFHSSTGGGSISCVFVCLPCLKG